jgi:hypothetical protein
MPSLYVEELASIALVGGGLVVDASLGVEALKKLALAGKRSGAKLHVRNAYPLGAGAMKDIALVSPGNVTFEV